MTVPVQTPCFVLDLKRLRQNLETALRIREQAGCKILLATKAFAMPAVFPMMHDYLDGTTASGEQEAQILTTQLEEKLRLLELLPPESQNAQRKELAKTVAADIRKSFVYMLENSKQEEEEKNGH